ncbi:hypothetical protein ACR6C2_41485 [Streptomyces sp. INA 01156]
MATRSDQGAGTGTCRQKADEGADGARSPPTGPGQRLGRDRHPEPTDQYRFTDQYQLEGTDARLPRSGLPHGPEGGRTARTPALPARPELPETQLRPQLLRLAVLPPVAVALSACAAVLFTVRSTGVRPGATLWSVLGGAGSVALAGIVVAAVAADRAARSVHERVESLRRSTARREADLGGLVDALRRGGTATPGARQDAGGRRRLRPARRRPVPGARRCRHRRRAGVPALQPGGQRTETRGVRQPGPAPAVPGAPRDLPPRRDGERDRGPDLLKGLFHVDHLATRIRRHAENLAVLGGAVSRRQWSNPVPMTEVLRSAIAEVEQYSRVNSSRRSTAPCAGTPSPTSSTCWPNSSRTPRCTPPRTPRCCSAPASSPPGSPSRSRTAGSACPWASRSG